MSNKTQLARYQKEQTMRPEKQQTYEDIEKIDDGNRYELIDGVIYMMSPPTSSHQDISTDLSRQFSTFFRGKPCKVYAAPFKVKLDEKNYYEPDLSVVCDKRKIVKDGCVGAPDLVVEILSPSTASHDKVKKFNTYLKAGVKEYWLVDPEDRTVLVNILANGEYVLKTYGENEIIPVQTFEGLNINMQEVFEDIW